MDFKLRCVLYVCLLSLRPEKAIEYHYSDDLKKNNEKKIVHLELVITNMKIRINKLIINGHLIDKNEGKEKITLQVLRKC